MLELQVKLSTGENVALRPYFNRQASRVYKEELFEGVDWIPNPDGVGQIPSHSPVVNSDRAWEAAMQFMIDRITDEAGNAVLLPVKSWIDGLREPDYNLIRDRIIDIRNSQSEKYEDGQKKS